MKTVNFIAPFSREECLRRLRASVEPERLAWSVYIAGFRVAGNTPSTSESGVIGKVEDTEIRLHKALSKEVTFNSFQTYLYGDLTDDGHQTRLECRIGMPPPVYAFMILWFGITLFISFILLIDGSPMTVDAFGEKYVVSGRWATVFPMLFAAFGGAVMKFGRYLARDEERFLVDFLRKTLDARETK